jgi:uncharacterized repeat protein (TIGR01451 family)
MFRASLSSGSALSGFGGRVRALLAGALLVVAVAWMGVDALADPASPITVTKTASSNPVASGAQLTYTIVIKNTAGAALSNVVMTDQVNGLGVIQQPPALPQLIISTTKGTCTQGGPNGNVVTCNVGGMTGGESDTVTIRGQVTSGAGTTLMNTAFVTGTKSAQNFSSSSNETDTLVTGSSGGGLPDLTINKTGPTSVAPGAAITYTLTVNNIGAANATGVKVVDTVPGGITGIAASGSSLFSCGVAVSTVTCTGGAVNAGQNATITITGTAPSSGTLTNTAVVDPDNTITETHEDNNTSATVNTTVGGPPPAPLLDIKKTDNSPNSYPWSTGAGPDPVNPGQQEVYKIQVTNNATGTTGRADDVVTTDATQGLDTASITATQTIVNGTVGTTGGCVVSGSQVKCSLKSLNSGGTQTITITGTVLQSAGSSIFDTATVTGNVKNQGVSNSASEVTTVRPKYDLTITKNDLGSDPVCARSWPVNGSHLSSPPDGLSPASGTPAPMIGAPSCLGGLTYQLEIGNSGIATATGVEFVDPLPAGLIFDSYVNLDGGGFACKLKTGNVVDCTGGTIGPNSTKHVNLLFVAPPTVGTITNTVTVDPNNTIFESDETNNTATQTTTVTTGIDLSIWKGDSPTEDPPGDAPPAAAGFDPIATNGTGTYNIIVENLGTQDATGIKVRDTLPAGTRFITAFGDHGFTCTPDGSATGGTVTCIGGSLLGTEAQFYTPPGGSPAPTGHRWATITIKFFATPFVQPAMHNEVRVDPDNEIAEADETNNIATDDTKVTVGDADKGAYNQLTITKTQVSPDPTTTDGTVATNGTLVYNLHVENKGTDPVSNVVVKDFLPTGSRFISAADTATGSAAFFCTQDGSATGGVVTCTGGDFDGTLDQLPGIGTTRDIRVTIFAPGVPGTYTNHATVDPDNVVPEGNEFDNDSSVSTKVTVGGNNEFNELNLTKTQTSPTTLCGGVPCVSTSSPVEYTLVVKNDGSDPAFHVVVRDTLPTGFTFASANDTGPVSDPNAFVCTDAGNVVTCTSARIDGGSATRSIVVRAFSAVAPGDYVNQAVVDPDNTIPEGDETNNTAQATTRVRVGAGFIDLQVTKTASPSTLDKGQHATPGGQIVYTITATNAGTDPAFNVKVQDTLPAGTTFVSALDTTLPLGPDPNRFTCTNASGVVTCTGATLDGSLGLAGVPTTRTILITVTAPNANILGLTNVVRIDPDNAIPESNETNNSAQAATDVQSDINLKITKTGPKSAHQNDSTQYVLSVSNTGPAAAHGVLVTDPLPVGLIPLGSVTAEPGNFACQVLENPVNVVSCTGDLNGAGDPNGFDKVTITIPVFITAEDGTTLDNQACVDPNNTIVESDESDNCSTNVTPVTAHAPDLLINKSVDKTSVTAGDPITYTLTVSNNGDANADGPVTVTDMLPVASADFVSANPDAAFTCPDPVGGVLTCTAAAGMTVGQSAKITIQMTVKSPLPAGTTSIENDASIAPGTCTAPCENEAVNPNRLLDNSATVKSTVGGSSIDLVMVNDSNFDTPDPVVAGQKLTYKLVVTNAGSASTTTAPAPNDVVVRTALPAGLDLDSAVASNGFVCTPVGPTTGPVGNVDCTGALDAGASTIVTLTSTVTASAGTSLTAVATVDPANNIVESDESNNSQTAVTSVVAAPCTSCIDLVAGSIIATPPSPVLNNTDVTYNFAVTNVGDEPTSASPTPLPHDVVVTIDLDTVFNESTPVSASAPGFTCVITSPPLLLTDPEIVCTSTAGLAGGAGTIFSVVAHVDTAATTPPGNFVDFDVVVDPANHIAEFNEANNSSSLRVDTHA